MYIFLVTYPATYVALLAEGVDRNSHRDIRQLPAAVALLAEGVDRNRSQTLRF